LLPTCQKREDCKVTESRAKALLRQLKDENPRWSQKKLFEEWRRLVHEDETLEEEIRCAAFDDLWQLTHKRFQN
jgi:hypothetical protein